MLQGGKHRIRRTGKTELRRYASMQDTSLYRLE